MACGYGFRYPAEGRTEGFHVEAVIEVDEAKKSLQDVSIAAIYPLF